MRFVVYCLFVLMVCWAVLDIAPHELLNDLMAYIFDLGHFGVVALVVVFYALYKGFDLTYGRVIDGWAVDHGLKLVKKKECGVACKGFPWEVWWSTIYYVTVEDERGEQYRAWLIFGYRGFNVLKVKWEGKAPLDARRGAR